MWISSAQYSTLAEKWRRGGREAQHDRQDLDKTSLAAMCIFHEAKAGADTHIITIIRYLGSDPGQ